jgi:hypothetical protein
MSFGTPEQQARWVAAQLRPEGSLLGRYRQAYLRGILGAALAHARRRSSALRPLEALLAGRSPRGSHSAGLRSVPIRAIVASEGRSGDFDTRFRPLRLDTWERWRSVARAYMRGDSLPPVELIAVGDLYAVRDGHHRVSAAAILGQLEVDALVTVLEM